MARIYSKTGGSRTEKRSPEFSAPLAGFFEFSARGAENSGPRFSVLDPPPPPPPCYYI